MGGEIVGRCCEAQREKQARRGVAIELPGLPRTLYILGKEGRQQQVGEAGRQRRQRRELDAEARGPHVGRKKRRWVDSESSRSQRAAVRAGLTMGDVVEDALARGWCAGAAAAAATASVGSSSDPVPVNFVRRVQMCGALVDSIRRDLLHPPRQV